MLLFLPALAVVVVLMWYAAALSIASAVAVAIPIVVVQNFMRQVHHMFDVWYNYKQSEERRALCRGKLNRSKTGGKTAANRSSSIP